MYMQGGEGSNSTFRRDTKSSYNLSSSIQKNLKPVHKVQFALCLLVCVLVSSLDSLIINVCVCVLLLSAN